MSQLDKIHKQGRPGWLPIGISVLAVLTALVHLYLAGENFLAIYHQPLPAGTSQESLLLFAILFLLNCIGYLVLPVALYLPSLRRFQRLIRWVFIGYTALTIGLWYVIQFHHADLFDYSDKLIEVLLIVLLLIEDWQTSRRTI